LSDAGFKWCLEDKKNLEKRGYTVGGAVWK
jgi:hypothetical protein